MREGFLNRREAAEFLTGRGLKTSHHTLKKLATTGGGPRYRRYGGNLCVYTEADLLQWAATKLSRPFFSTSDADANRVLIFGE